MVLLESVKHVKNYEASVASASPQFEKASALIPVTGVK